MPVDAKENELRVGDVVMLPCRVKYVGQSEGSGLAPITLQALATHPITGEGLDIGGLSSGQVIRGNEGDDLSYNINETQKNRRSIEKREKKFEPPHPPTPSTPPVQTPAKPATPPKPNPPVVPHPDSTKV